MMGNISGSRLNRGKCSGLRNVTPQQSHNARIVATLIPVKK
jgi:hypothetical protein